MSAPAVPAFDNSTLSWVHAEVDLALAQAGEALARHAAAPGDPAPRTAARNHLHQACGALTIVGLAGVSHVAAAIETCVAQLDVQADGGVAAASAAGTALAALRRYLDALMAGHPDQPLRLFPPYRALLLAAGQAEPTPLDLFFPDLTRRPPRREAATAPLAPARIKALRLGFARGLAKWREGGEARGFTEMRNAVAHVEQACAQPGERALWWVALAWFDLPTHDAQAGTLLDALDRQFAALESCRSTAVPDALLAGLLYAIAVAPPGDALRESVRAAYRLADLIPAATATGETRRDACRAPLATAMAEWEAFARGSAIALVRFHDVMQLLLAAARDSGDAELGGLIAGCADFAVWLRRQPERADAAVMLEVAGALLLAEDAVAREGARSPVDAPLFAAEAEAQLARLDSLSHGAALPADVRRRWHDHRLVVQCAEAILAELAAAEQVLDAYFHAPASGTNSALGSAEARLHAVAGALVLLDRTEAALLGRQLEARVAACRAGMPQEEDFAAVAERLAALAQYVDSLRRGAPDGALLAPFAGDDVALAGNGTAELLAVLRAALADAAGSELQKSRRSAAALTGTAAQAGSASAYALADALERALDRFVATGSKPDEAARMLLARVAGALEGMFGALAEGRQPPAEADLCAALAALAPADDVLATQLLPRAGALPATPPPAPPAAESSPATATAVDAQLAEIFLEEADEHLPALAATLQAWRDEPASADHGHRLARILHTFKGGARMCGALELGACAHETESQIAAMLQAAPTTEDFAACATALDRLGHLTDALRAPAPPPARPADPPAAAAVPVALPAAQPVPVAPPRLRADLLDRLIAEAGEITGARCRLDGSVKASKTALLDLNDNIARLRSQLREFEILAETGMQSQHRSGGSGEFDPLELDRFTRLQELARLMNESASDMALVQGTLQRQAENAGAALAVQSRHDRELTHGLLTARLVPFGSIGERLQRVVRQAARELDREAELVIADAEVAIDRSVLDRLLAPLEHLLRNAVAHGIEAPEARRSAGKPDAGRIALALAADENGIALTLADDGRGLDLEAIRQRAVAQGLLAAAATADAALLAELVFRPGFSTATAVNEIAGRGVGLDVVRTEVDQLGGRIVLDSTPGQGTQFHIALPPALSMASLLLVQAGGQQWAIPAALVEDAQELAPAERAARRSAGGEEHNGRHYPWHALAGLYALPPAAGEGGWRLLLDSGGLRIALEVDDVTQHQEAVVKPVDALLARVPGLTGATVLADGSIALVINPVTLAERRQRPAGGVSPASTFGIAAAPPAATLMVVDDSLTVRKITGRLLERAGYRVLLAKDGVDALEQLAAQPAAALPAVMLADIEMPRMDGFELVRALRADARLTALPVIMITSRSAERHRQVARELGVQHYLGKPYDEDELLRLVADLLPLSENTPDAR